MIDCIDFIHYSSQMPAQRADAFNMLNNECMYRRTFSWRTVQQLAERWATERRYTQMCYR